METSMNNTLERNERPLLARDPIEKTFSSAASFPNRKFDRCSIAFGIAEFEKIRAIYGKSIQQELLRAIEIKIRKNCSLGDYFNFLPIAHTENEVGILTIEGYLSEENNIEADIKKIVREISGTSIATSVGRVSVLLSAGVAVMKNMASIDAVWAGENDLVAWSKAALSNIQEKGFADVLVLHPEDSPYGWYVAAQQACLWVENGFENQLFFVYQPVVDAITNEALYYECLVRVVSDDGTIVTPGTFVPAIEEMGMIGKLDKKVITKSLEELSYCDKISLSCNVSAHSLSEPAWCEEVLGIIEERSEFAPRLIIEITETSSIKNIDCVSRFVGQVKKLGCSVALDDFGVGFASFAVLSALDVDYVKVDRSYARYVGNDTLKKQLVHLVGLAASICGSVVLEGVEEELQIDQLKNLEGITHLQGYYFGQPSFSRPWNIN